MKINIEGMGCKHCEERIKDALQQIKGIAVLSVSKEDKCAVIEAQESISEEQIRDTVAKAHDGGMYTVVGFEQNDMEEQENCCCSGKLKERDEKERRNLINRLKRIEGQVRGIENMLDNDVYCTDILIQVAAVNAALNSFNKVLLANHMKTCVADNIRNGNDEVIDELVVLLQKLMK